MKLIKIKEEHYVVVDDSEIKEGEHYINIEPGNPFFGKIYKGVDQILKEGYSGNGYKNPDYFKTWMKKITHSTQPLELLSENGLSGMGFSKIRPLNVFEVKELIGEVNVEKKMISPYPINTQNDVDWCNGYQRGYNQALEDNKEKKYTQDDLKKAIDMAEKMTQEEGGLSSSFIDKIIQSLQPKTEWEVEIINGKFKIK